VEEKKKRSKKGGNVFWGLKFLQNANGSLKSKMERRRLVAKCLVQHGFVGWQHRRAADAPSVAGFAKVSGCLNALAQLEWIFRLPIAFA